MVANTSKVIDNRKIESIMERRPSLINTLIRKLLRQQIDQKPVHTALHTAEELEIFKRDAIENKSKHCGFRQEYKPES